MRSLRAVSTSTRNDLDLPDKTFLRLLDRCPNLTTFEMEWNEYSSEILFDDLKHLLGLKNLVNLRLCSIGLDEPKFFSRLSQGKGPFINDVTL